MAKDAEFARRTPRKGLAAGLVVGAAFDPVVKESFGKVQAQGSVAHDLVGVALGEVEVVDVAEGRAGRGVDVETGLAAEVSDAEEVGGVGDDDDVLEMAVGSDLLELGDLLGGVEGVGFGKDGGEGD